MSSKQTPGPWEVREVDGLFAIAHPTGWVLESNDEQQNRTDAVLIAAAPELLEACQQAVAMFDRIHTTLEASGQHERNQVSTFEAAMRAAVRKATGE